MYGQQVLEPIFMNVEVGLLIIDRNGKIKMANRNVLEFFGWEHDNIDGKLFNEVQDINYGWGKKFWDIFQLHKIHQKKTIESILIKVKGNYKLLELKLTPPTMLNDYTEAYVIMIDEKENTTTSSKAYRNRVYELRKLRSQAKRVFDYLFDAIVTIDRTGTITYLNTGIEKIFNIRKDDFLGTSYTELLEFSNTYKAECFSLLEKSLFEGEKYINYEVQAKNSEGEIKTLKGITLPLYDDEGSFLGVTGIYKDITKEKEQEKKQEKWEERFRMTEKLAIVGEMAAGTAHEIKNPLSAIKGFLQLLESDKIDENKREQYLKIVREELNRLEDIVKEFLQLSKPSKAIETDEISLCEVFSKTLSFLKPKFETNKTDLYFSCSGFPIIIRGDRNKLQQVFINIIKNALEAIEKNYDDKYISITVQLDDFNETVQIQFIDSGPGIPDGVINKLFSPFATTKKSGTGLGLPVSMQIIRSFGGYLEAKNHEDAGACFKMELPTKSVDYEYGTCYKYQKNKCERVFYHE
ncbi:hypothetical protein CDO51_12685 [Natranaerobius trueperi]|uniref:histidine kinase n=1 Tax=Natranaerobius trueperi TaxID=759412 RepID=A0A226BWX5_9FIRM|nr:hypothetical protein CDO51_12685 [Natranaerobius trueperi]